MNYLIAKNGIFLVPEKKEGEEQQNYNLKKLVPMAFAKRV